MITYKGYSIPSTIEEVTKQIKEANKKHSHIMYIDSKDPNRDYRSSIHVADFTNMPDDGKEILICQYIHEVKTYIDYL